MISIYALMHPKTNDIFYIGASKTPILRVKQHYHAKSNKIKLKFLNEIRLLGLNPTLIILDECEKDRVRELEEFYIEMFSSYGFPINQLRTSGYKTGVPNDFGNSPYPIRMPSELRSQYVDHAKKLDRSLHWVVKKALRWYSLKFPLPIDE